MSIEELQKKLESNGYEIGETYNIPYGKQFKTSNRATITCFDKGTIQVQGKTNIKKEIDGIIGLRQPNHEVKISAKPQGNKSNKVFVVYGHDKDARDQLEAMLRRWGLDPLILDQLPSGGQTIIEKLENYTQQGEFGIVLATPDDEGYRKGHEDEKALRARQNVVLEMGMLLSKLGRDRVAILLKSQTDMERPSDIQGLIYISFKDNISEAGLTLAKEMATKGYDIDIQKI